MSTIFRRTVFLLLVLALVGVVAMVGSKLWVDAQTRGSIYAYDDASLPKQHVALVFGAGLNIEGEPTSILYDRVATAVDLYQMDKVDKLLMTGDNSTVTHNEVEAMRLTAIDLGVPSEDIVLDYAGFSTWDSCYRAREIFSLSEATLVTQEFHLPRAIFSCDRLGVKSVGVKADRQPYTTSYNELREMPAVASTLWNLLTNRKPKFLGPKVDVDAEQGP
jgi:vancomycin permeability regulator SanA